MTEREITQIESREVESIIKSHFENMPITLEQFLQSVQDNGILVQLPKPHYKFVHRSFQEYLAATYVKDIQQPELLVKCMNFMNLKWWHETIVLYCAQADPTPIIEACLKDMSLSKDALDLALTLYFWEPEVEKNVDQQKKSKPEVREAWERLDQTMSLAMEDKDIKLQEEIAGALLRLRRKYLIPDDEAPEGEPTKDTSLITCAEYQLFLDQPENQTRQPDHWKDDHYPRGQWLKPILGVRPSDANAFCNWLSAQEDAGAWRYRLPTSEETRDIFVTREAGRGYWIRDGNEYQFVREKEGSLSSSILSQDRLYDLWARAQDDVESSLKPKERLLADCISIVRKLEDVRRFHHALIEHVTSIREHISRRESDLQAKHKDTLEHKKGLENQIDTASAKKAEFEQTLKEIKSWKTQLTKINIEKMELQESLRDVREKKEDLQRERESLAEDFINSQRRKAGNMPQEQPTSDSGIQQAKQSQELKIAKYDQIKRIIEEKEREQKDLEKDLETANSKESELIEQLHGADEKEMSAKRQREDARKQEYNLAKKLESAKDEAKNAKQQLDSFSSFANKFYKIYKVFSLFRSTDSNALSAALANTQWLNLDRILAARANEKALDNVCAIINHNIEELTNRLDLFQRESDIAFANIESDIDNALTNARKLVHQFDQITVGRYVQKLDDVLRFCCGQLATNEKRSSMKNRRSRLHIRYFAKALAEHLSYWLQKELFSSDDSFDSFSTFQSMSRFYFDIYVAFALLEERINGNLSASEGILIVREQSTQEKTTKQLSGVIGE
ncbi:MAG TPA: hypothetical protein VN207_02830 [Ktedonobacteraceae bacterium]|nr:hypothetical protein [Ktedonobacteraceae bacterium]